METQLKKEFIKIGLQDFSGSHSENEYGSFTSFEAGSQGLGHDRLLVGIVGLNTELKEQIKQFVDGKFYEALDTNAVILTEAGDVLFSHIYDIWTLTHEDLDSLFQKQPIQFERVKSIAETYLNDYGLKPEESVSSEVLAIVKGMAKSLAELVARSPEALRSIEWRQLEQMLAEVLGGMGFSVELTPPSKDDGRDIILGLAVNGVNRSYIVEVKHWTSNKVGPAPIEKFLKVVIREKRDAGIFVSTYGYTSNAFEALSEIDRRALRFGEKEFIVTCCKLYVNKLNGMVLPTEILPEVIVRETK